MARPPKEGVDYFNTDSKFDDNLEAFLKLHLNDGMAFTVRFWQGAYLTNAGELDLGNSTQVKGFAATCNVSVEKLTEMIEDAMNLKFVCRKCYESRKVLTSSGIKKRIARIKGERNRKKESYAGVNRGETEEEPGQTEPQPKNNRGSVSLSLLVSNSDLEKGGPGEKTPDENKSPPATEPPAPKAQKPPPGYREGCTQGPVGIWLKPEERAKLSETLEPGEDIYWLEQLFSARENNPEVFDKKYKNHYRTALNWRQMKREKGLRWNASEKMYDASPRNKLGEAPRPKIPLFKPEATPKITEAERQANLKRLEKITGGIAK